VSGFISIDSVTSFPPFIIRNYLSFLFASFHVRPSRRLARKDRHAVSSLLTTCFASILRLELFGLPWVLTMADAAVTAPQHQHAHQHQHHRPTSQGPSSSSTKLDSTTSSTFKTAAPGTQSLTHILSPRDDVTKESSPAPISSTAPFGQNLKTAGTSSSHTNDSSRRIAEMSTATVATAAPSASAVPKQFSADNKDFNTSHQAPSPASADSRHPSQSEAGPPSVFTVIDNDSVATHGTTPSPTTGRKLDLPPVVRKGLPSASPDVDEKAHLSG
jgi:hypothetical protein